MKVCHCTLGGTRACMTCPQNPGGIYDDMFELTKVDIPEMPHFKTPRKPKKTIVEEFDGEGMLIKRTIMEE